MLSAAMVEQSPAAIPGAAIARGADLLISIFGKKLAREEAALRAEAARSYSGNLSADYWLEVASEISSRK